MRRFVSVLGAVAAVTLASVACSDTTQQLGGSIVRTATSQAGAAAFKNAGYPIQGELSCKSTSQGDSAYEVNCTGVTTKNEPVTLNGSVDKNAQAEVGKNARITGVKFVGTAGSKIVFNTTCIGTDC
ncbi:hypothetical protein [Wenjunlia tyrosinilytica]|uniref:Lipoprotein n=1 Tax=Wenjunlia tyrosinilytica TaxID=1544741 RepID=A0A918DVP6_9ACTN|nr:hypothetical protein [Wenjunlia tyrosinilytica]GGO84645.1 hypothetical protein GCM10012280_16590 [Wenjunlia tyrosinilytica]